MLLSDIHTPDDLRRQPLDQLQPIAGQLRDYIIDTLATHPGHLASSLGTVELTVALHYVFNTPDDKVVWDVGHQAYAHKILTGRGERFSTIRTYGGLSGFPRRDESDYDAFGTGHSSTSISAALGMATASKLQGNTSRNHIAVIGDGALTGGEAFEALNNVGCSRANILIILNDNGISIDEAVGGLDSYLTRITSSRKYNRLKEQVWQRLDGTDGRKRHSHSIGFFQRLTSMAKTMALGSSNLFESLGIRYFGPIDGHNIDQLVDMLRRMKELDGPKLLHVVTVKGKGLRQAEENPVAYHAPGRYDIRTGDQIKSSGDGGALKYQDVFGHTLTELARANKAIVGITPAMLTGCSLSIMKEAMPERVFDVGIAEQHAVTFSAGLAAEGMLPFCNIYSSFSQRAYDSVIHDVALQKLKVILCLDRGGLVGEDGATHHGVFDMAAFRPVPNLTLCAPLDEASLRDMMYSATQPAYGATVIRYPRGYGHGTPWRDRPFNYIEPGTAVKLHEGNGVALLSIGAIGMNGVRAVERAGTEKGLEILHYDMRFLKPVDTAALQDACSRCRHIVTLEDGAVEGGLYSVVAEFIAANGLDCTLTGLGIPDRFVEQGTPAELYQECGMDTDSVYQALLNENF